MGNNKLEYHLLLDEKLDARDLPTSVKARKFFHRLLIENLDKKKSVLDKVLIPRVQEGLSGTFTDTGISRKNILNLGYPFNLIDSGKLAKDPFTFLKNRKISYDQLNSLLIATGIYLKENKKL